MNKQQMPGQRSLIPTDTGLVSLSSIHANEVRVLHRSLSAGGQTLGREHRAAG